MVKRNQNGRLSWKRDSRSGENLVYVNNNGYAQVTTCWQVAFERSGVTEYFFLQGAEGRSGGKRVNVRHSIVTEVAAHRADQS